MDRCAWRCSLSLALNLVSQQLTQSVRVSLFGRRCRCSESHGQKAAACDIAAGESHECALEVAP